MTYYAPSSTIAHQQPQRYQRDVPAGSPPAQQSQQLMTNSSSSTMAQHAKQQLEVLYEMSKLLRTGLTRDQLTISIQLIEAGMDPETLAALMKELKREAAAMQQYQ